MCKALSCVVIKINVCHIKHTFAGLNYTLWVGSRPECQPRERNCMQSVFLTQFFQPIHLSVKDLSGRIHSEKWTLYENWFEAFFLSNTWIVRLSLCYSHTSYECTQSDYWRTVNNPFHFQKRTTAESIIKIRHSEQGLVSQYLINLANFLRIVPDEFQFTVLSNRTSLCLKLILNMVSPPHSRILGFRHRVNYFPPKTRHEDSRPCWSIKTISDSCLSIFWSRYLSKQADHRILCSSFPLARY